MKPREFVGDGKPVTNRYTGAVMLTVDHLQWADLSGAEGYPHLGGDIEVMAEVDRLVDEARRQGALEATATRDEAIRDASSLYHVEGSQISDAIDRAYELGYVAWVRAATPRIGQPPIPVPVPDWVGKVLANSTEGQG